MYVSWCIAIIIKMLTVYKMRVYIYIYIYICMFMEKCLDEYYVYLFARVRVSMCMYISVYACVYVCNSKHFRCVVDSV